MSFFSAIIHGFRPREREDSTLAQAKKDMQTVKVPMYIIWDIFDRSKIELAKASFSDELKKEPGPGVTLFCIQREFKLTLEGYFVDKHLSSRIPTSFMKALVPHIEQGVKEEPQLFRKPEDASSSSRTGHFMGIIEHFKSTGFVKNFREVNPEVYFMMRVAERLRIQEETKLFKELSFPELKSETARENLKKGMQGVAAGDYFSIPLLNATLSEEDEKAARDYCQTVFDMRNQRMLTIVKEAWAKDLKAREKNPNAPLTNLVTLVGYEDEIYQKRKMLYLQTAAGVVIVAILFFLQRKPLLFKQLAKAMKTQLLFLLFSLQNRVKQNPPFFVKLAQKSQIRSLAATLSKAAITGVVGSKLVLEIFQLCRPDPTENVMGLVKLL